MDDGSTGGTWHSCRAAQGRTGCAGVVAPLSPGRPERGLIPVCDFIISMDGDDSTRLPTPQMMELFEQGYDIIQAQRIEWRADVFLQADCIRGFMP
jgi:hypothetical protein